jgi:hypothetical protein
MVCKVTFQGIYSNSSFIVVLHGLELYSEKSVGGNCKTKNIVAIFNYCVLLSPEGYRGMYVYSCVAFNDYGYDLQHSLCQLGLDELYSTL